MRQGVGGGGVLHVLLVKHLTGAACRKCLAGSAASLEKSLPARHLLNAGNLQTSTASCPQYWRL